MFIRAESNKVWHRNMNFIHFVQIPKTTAMQCRESERLADLINPLLSISWPYSKPRHLAQWIGRKEGKYKKKEKALKIILISYNIECDDVGGQCGVICVEIYWIVFPSLLHLLQSVLCRGVPAGLASVTVTREREGLMSSKTNTQTPPTDGHHSAQKMKRSLGNFSVQPSLCCSEQERRVWR